MNIAIDIQPIVSKSKYRGIGKYVTGLLNSLFKQDKENKYFLFNMYEPTNINELLSFGDNVQYSYFYMGDDSYLLTKMFYHMDIFYQKNEDLLCELYQKYIEANKIDLFFISSPIDVWCSYKKEWFAGTKVATIIYDLIPQIFSDDYFKGEGSKKRYREAINFLRSADKLLAISQSVKNDCINLWGISPEKIDVIYSGVDERFNQYHLTEEAADGVLKRLHISGKFLLFPSAPDYRKNLYPTLEAYGLLPEQIKNEYQLVITGSVFPEFKAELLNRIGLMGLRGNVVVTDYISTDELIALYKNARLLVFPSMYEGFGLPVLEAFVTRLPVVTSNNSSLLEIAKDAAVLVDPFDIQSIADGIQTALDTDFVQFEPEIQKRVAYFTWDNTAKLTRESIEAIGASEPETFEEEGTKRCIAYFAPINQESPLKYQYLSVLELLAGQFEVDVFVEDSKGLDFQKNNIRIKKASDFGAYSNKYFETVFYLANDPGNMYMIPCLRANKGVVILNDLNLHRGAYEYNVLRNENWKEYETIVSDELSNGKQIVQMLRDQKADSEKVVEELALNRFVLEYAKKIIVYRQEDRKYLLEDNVGYNIKIFDIPVLQDTEKERFYKFIIMQKQPAITEKFLNRIILKEILPRDLNCLEEVKKLSATFAYIMEETAPEPSLGAQKTNGELMEVDSRKIMESIYTDLEKQGIQISRN